MNALTTRSQLPVLDTSHQWQRDGIRFGLLVTTSNAFIQSFHSPFDPWALGSLILLGGLSGMLISPPVRSMVNRLRGRLPMWALGLLMPVVGGLWGWGVGAVWMAVITGGEIMANLGFWMSFSALLAAPIGMILVGLLWLPYAMTAVLRLPRWPIMSAAALLSGMVSWWWLAMVFSITQ